MRNLVGDQFPIHCEHTDAEREAISKGTKESAPKRRGTDDATETSASMSRSRPTKRSPRRSPKRCFGSRRIINLWAMTPMRAGCLHSPSGIVRRRSGLSPGSTRRGKWSKLARPAVARNRQATQASISVVRLCVRQSIRTSFARNLLHISVADAASKGFMFDWVGRRDSVAQNGRRRTDDRGTGCKVQLQVRVRGLRSGTALVPGGTKNCGPGTVLQWC